MLKLAQLIRLSCYVMSTIIVHDSQQIKNIFRNFILFYSGRKKRIKIKRLKIRVLQLSLT